MKRIVFLDYVRVFACFLVMVVHASENFYGAPGSTDMVGPQAFLANESDRLWVSIYDGFSRMGRAVVYNSLRFSSCADEGRADHVAVLSSALYPHSTTVFHIHDTLQYSADVVGTD